MITRQERKDVIWQVRQGDVFIVKSDKSKIPSHYTKTKKCTLALGEVTGHHHTIERGAMGYASDENELAHFFEVTDKEATITHQEHGPITFGEGVYEYVQQYEYSPEIVTRVAD